MNQCFESGYGDFEKVDPNPRQSQEWNNERKNERKLPLFQIKHFLNNLNFLKNFI